MDYHQKSNIVCLRCGAFKVIKLHGVDIICEYCGENKFISVRVAHYRLQSLLGVGGMSVVMSARDLALGRRVAIKLLKDSTRDSEELVANFERECSMMARVRHPNIVSLYSAGWEGEQFYIAMELVDGKNLEMLIKEIGSIPQYMTLYIARQIVLGLMAAHREGLLHRDIKPGNVLLLDNGVAKVLDFGLAQKNNEAPVDEVIWATPYYVSPETLRQEHEDIRSDIYALGMTLRHMLTAIDVFPSDPQSATDLLLAKSQLKPLSSKKGYICENLCIIINKMTQFDSKKRYVSYETLLLELDSTINSINMRRHIGFLRQRRKKTLASIAMLVVLLFVSMLIITLSNLQSLKPFNQMDNTALLMPEEDYIIESYEESIKKKDWPRTIAALTSLSKLNRDPQLGIWASQMAWNIIYQTHGNKHDLVKMRKRMLEHVAILEKKGKLDMNGLDVEFQAMQHWKSLCKQLEISRNQNFSQWAEFSLNLIETQRFVETYQWGKLEQSLNSMQLLVDSGNIQWGMHSSLYTPWRKHMENLACEILPKRYDDLQNRGDFAQLGEWAKIINNSPYAEEKLRQEALITEEIANVADAYLSALKRRAGDSIKNNQDFKTRKALIQKHFSTLNKEVMAFICLELMGRGEYKIAREHFADYKGDDADSFFIIMTDWFARLDKASIQ